MITDKYNTYDNEYINYSYPFSFKKQNKDYLTPNRPTTVKWFYGDTASLNLLLYDKLDYVFAISGIPDYIYGREAVVTIYNFRGEPVYNKVFSRDFLESEWVKAVDGDERIALNIRLTEKESKTIFIKGDYSLGIKLIDADPVRYDLGGYYKDVYIPTYVEITPDGFKLLNTDN